MGRTSVIKGAARKSPSVVWSVATCARWVWCSDPASGLARAKEASAEGARRVFARLYVLWAGEVGVVSMS